MPAIGPRAAGLSTLRRRFRMFAAVALLLAASPATSRGQVPALAASDPPPPLDTRPQPLPPIAVGESKSLSAAPHASAGNAPDRLAEMARRLDAAEAELRALRDQNGTLEDRPEIELVGFQAPPANPTDPRDPHPYGEKETAAPRKAGFPNAKLTGFTQLDGGWYGQTPVNMATVGDAQDGVGFRRARVAVVGNVAEFTTYMLEVDFATAGRPSFFDVWLEQGNLPILGAVRAGQYLQPFSVDAMSGFRNLPFLERSLPFLAFVPFRRVGVMSSNISEDQYTTWANSVFRTGGFNNAPLGDSRFATDIGDSGGFSYSTRATHLIFYDEAADDRYLWAVGASYDYSRLTQDTAAGSGTIAGSGPSAFYQTKVLPEFGPLGAPEVLQNFGQAAAATPVFVDSGRYAAKSFHLFGTETVAQAGPWSFQSEWMGTSVDSVVGPVFYHGAYAEVMYRLTGETRPYDKKLGALKNVIPFTDFISLRPGGVRGWGAWEVAARVSYVDINNPDKLKGHYYNPVTNTYTSTTGDVGNGRLTDYTLGMTWFLNEHAKLQFNWIHALLDNKFTGPSDANLYVTRAQVDF